MLEQYQKFPLEIDPIAIAVGSFSIGWYSLMYLSAFVAVFVLLLYRIKKGEGDYGKEEILDLFIFSLVGALAGGRLGYVLLYNPIHYLRNPLEIISPYDFGSGQWVGIYGMSYHGGLMGVVLAMIIFSRISMRKKGNFWALADFVAPAVPAGYFFGRIGNFFNGELYGRLTDSWVGMYFSSAIGNENLLRYPSQLIEALLEGLILFAILWPLRNKRMFPGYFAALYLIGYGIFRIIGEFFREPDEHVGFFWGYFTLGQIFSLMMVLAGIMIYVQRRKKML